MNRRFGIAGERERERERERTNRTCRIRIKNQSRVPDYSFEMTHSDNFDALLFARHLNPSLISVSMKRDGPIAIVIVYHKAE